MANDEFLEEDLAEGRAEGHAEGLAEGLAEGQRKVAKNMKAKGLAPELISSCTGLAVEEIKTL